MPDRLGATAAADWLAAHPPAAAGVGLAALLLAAWLAYLLSRRVLVGLVGAVIRRSRFRWDDALLARGVLRRAALLAPLLVAYFGLGAVPGLPEAAAGLAQRVVVALVLVAALAAVSALLSAAHDVYASLPLSRGRPMKGYLQILKIFLVVVGAVLAIAILLDRSPWAFLTGIGAMTAVILLIFRDTILSLVASLQLASNDMVRLGDWIEMPQYGADGDVIDIALHTVKVQNWDKTITTIPTYKLIEQSFKNWRGMTEAGGRRIKRALYVDMTSVRFLEPDDLERFSRFVLLRDYLAAKRVELERHNRRLAPAGSGWVANARRLTNLGTFRAYVAAYLRQHPQIHSEGMTFLVRQLEPGPTGIPLELYVFTRTTAWAEYEAIQADVFDHLLAILPEFDLRVFQQPTGWDLAGIGQLPPGAARPPIAATGA